jgi:hypothetical protein
MDASKEYVAIGGVGGSGTRLVAEMLIAIGYYLGSDLNHAKDNRWFTFFFKHPGLFGNDGSADVKSIQRSLQIFKKALDNNLKIGIFDVLHIVATMISWYKSYRFKDYKSSLALWPLRRILSLLTTTPRTSDDSINPLIGWKEPNCHIFLDYLPEHFSQIKYIHVIRHGLDMAYSSNQAQLHNWGKLFGISVVPANDDLLPNASVEYWIRANQRAISKGQHLFGKGFLLINFDELCQHPHQHITTLLNFLGIENNKPLMCMLQNMPAIPKSLNRHKKFGLSHFSDYQIEAVEALGFSV